MWTRYMQYVTRLTMMNAFQDKMVFTTPEQWKEDIYAQGITHRKKKWYFNYDHRGTWSPPTETKIF